MKSTYFNTGIYTVRDAARWSDVSPGRIRRWSRGYHYHSRGKKYASPPVWTGQWQPLEHTLYCRHTSTYREKENQPERS